MRWCFLIFLYVPIVCSLERIHSLTYGVVVPIQQGGEVFVDEIIRAYEMQTAPIELIAFIVQEVVDEHLIEYLYSKQRETDQFEIVIITDRSQKKLNALERIEVDVWMVNEIDTLPSKERVQITKTFFETTDIECLFSKGIIYTSPFPSTYQNTYIKKIGRADALQIWQEYGKNMAFLIAPFLSQKIYDWDEIEFAQKGAVLKRRFGFCSDPLYLDRKGF